MCSSARYKASDNGGGDAWGGVAIVTLQEADPRPKQPWTGGKALEKLPEDASSFFTDRVIIASSCQGHARCKQGSMFHYRDYCGPLGLRLAGILVIYHQPLVAYPLLGLECLLIHGDERHTSPLRVAVA